MNWAIVAVIIAGLGLLVNTAGLGFIAWLTQKGRADAAELRAAILAEIKTQLGDYVIKSQFKDYSESHGKEHTRIEQEMTRLADWKNNAAPIFGGLGTQLDAMLKAIGEMKEDLKDKAARAS